MCDMDEDFKEFHDKMVLENLLLKSKVEALESFVLESLARLLAPEAYKDFRVQYVREQSEVLNENLKNSQVYDSTAVHESLNRYRRELDSDLQNELNWIP